MMKEEKKRKKKEEKRGGGGGGGEGRKGSLVEGYEKKSRYHTNTWWREPWGEIRFHHWEFLGIFFLLSVQ